MLTMLAKVQNIIGTLLISGLLASVHAENQQYSILNASQYHQQVNDSRHKINNILHELKGYRNQDKNRQVAYIVKRLSDIPSPFNASEGIGEGDWQPKSFTYKPGAIHINQNPVYRLDFLDCQTFVQVALALLYSNSLNQFDRNYLKISYGSAGNPNNEMVHYYNRNHFIDADFNPINQRNGWLTDVTSQGVLSSHASVSTAKFNRKNWFLQQQKNLTEHVRVLNRVNGPAMAKRFATLYLKNNNRNFTLRKITLSYLDKNKLVIKKPDGKYQPNTFLFDEIPTPAIAEIASDMKDMKNSLGTEFNVSHLGLIYRETFQYGELIYQRITCVIDAKNEKQCQVNPIICQKKYCNELMFAHATQSHPNRHYWYQNKDGSFICSSNKPLHKKFTRCNRVEQLPFFDYLTDYQYGSHWRMEDPTVLGIHIEKLS